MMRSVLCRCVFILAPGALMWQGVAEAAPENVMVDLSDQNLDAILRIQDLNISSAMSDDTVVVTGTGKRSGMVLPKAKSRTGAREDVTEREGFEPPGACAPPVFKTGARPRIMNVLTTTYRHNLYTSRRITWRVC